MSSNVVRIFGEALPSQASGKAGVEQIQLDLFDRPHFRYILCLPMLELHGDTFVRLISKYRPSAVLDLRSHPYFGRPALDRSIAFDLFEKNSSMYIHRAFELKAPEDQKGYWKLRSDAASFFSKELNIFNIDQGITVAVLLHREDEIDVLAQAIRQVGDSLSWYIISPKLAP